MPDKHEEVVAQLRVGPLRRFFMADAQLDAIASILRREYGDARRDALEEVAKKMDRMGCSAHEDGDNVAACVFQEAADVIRAAKEEARE
jgi:hypothetical protein